MDYSDLKKYIKQCISLTKKDNLRIIISFHQTSSTEKNNTFNYYTLPPRVFERYLICGFCNLDQEFIIMLAKEFDKYTNYYLVDLEKKGIVGIGKYNQNLITGNLEGRLEDVVDKKKILGIRFDSLTAEHVINSLVKENPFLYKKSILLIGLGKIGFKIAYSLLECGNNIEIYSRNYQDVFDKCNCMDIIKPDSTLARPVPHRKLESSLINKDIIILATNSKNILNEVNCKLVKDSSRIISIGHGEVSKAAIEDFNSRKIYLSRIDIGKSLIEYVRRLLDANEIRPKRKKINGKFYVSGGFIGSPGDIVVDDADNPGLIYGFITKDQEFMRELSFFGGEI